MALTQAGLRNNSDMKYFSIENVVIKHLSLPQVMSTLLNYTLDVQAKRERMRKRTMHPKCETLPARINLACTVTHGIFSFWTFSTP